ncbi:MAG: glutamate formimidoyltransferase [Euryarchaeota archaeon]|mgnify:CR=1 FL=1|jgi:glutamate formiminotransferase/formiminotetrahydrofolate cyclodeaminase|nr:glutamate formimidoyltransferase [Euryarchaeota archaeon]MBT3971840.1 glutamate formimidoyltransferase [Euryarchaeota archaeon]MBT4407717.1 glutamate formimidoyltransferase [Euryarchaeota archaeon]MBT6645735.1 glutamate formimidoyltransferase [Euryarchaeota archaeon]
MQGQLVECVPNFSEGKDKDAIAAILASVSGIDNCHLLSAEPDADYNRTVVTLVGMPDAVSEGAFRIIAAAQQNIDMRNHTGEHPRLGAVDVCPFIPLRDISMEECARLAHHLGNRVATELNLPVYHYGAAASDDSRKVLSVLRKGEYEGLEGRLTEGESVHSNSTRWPDQGPRIWSESTAKFGAVVIGARPILVAYNVNLNEKDAKVAKLVGTLVRSSGRLLKQEDGRRMRIPGMLHAVQGMGVPLDSHGLSQVSMNLIDVEACPLHWAYEAVKSVAADHGVEAAGSELIGLAPLESLLASGRWYHSTPDSASDEELVDAAVEGLGLSSLSPFNPRERIIEWAAERSE